MQMLTLGIDPGLTGAERHGPDTQWPSEGGLHGCISQTTLARYDA